MTGTQPKRLYNPRDLKFDASGNLYVNDQGNNRIQKFMIEFPPNCSASKLDIIDKILCVLYFFSEIHKI